MTALTQFERLEASGLWRERPEAQRRDVLLSLGDATLMISDHAGRVLSHWSLPAIERINPTTEPLALYRPGPDARELLEIDDQIMIDALAKVQRAIARARPRPGRLRGTVIAGTLAFSVGMAVFWLPGALTRQAIHVVPQATRAALGEALLTRIRRVAGPRCETPGGSHALDRLAERLLPDGGRIVVLSDGVRASAHLPGRIVLINKALVEDYEDPAVVAGFIVAELARARAEDPLASLLRQTGLGTALRLLTTGRIPDDTLDGYAERLLTSPPVPITDDVLLSAFREQNLSATPYAYALDITGEATLALIEADPVAPEAADSVLSDGNWVALQGICGE